MLFCSPDLYCIYLFELQPQTVTEELTFTKDEEADFSSPQGWPGDYQPATAHGDDDSAACGKECSATRGDDGSAVRGDDDAAARDDDGSAVRGDDDGSASHGEVCTTARDDDGSATRGEVCSTARD